MNKNVFALVLAGALMVPHITPAVGNDTTIGFGGVRPGTSAQESRSELRLPPVPYLESIPWLTQRPPAPTSKVDMLWQPRGGTLGPFLLQPEIQPSKFSLSQQPAGDGSWTR